jgi:hypothetical protein
MSIRERKLRRAEPTLAENARDKPARQSNEVVDPWLAPSDEVASEMDYLSRAGARGVVHRG